jgi:peptidoglycan/LPS O-acetylase OafA/YrhL
LVVFSTCRLRESPFFRVGDFLFQLGRLRSARQSEWSTLQVLDPAVVALIGGNLLWAYLLHVTEFDVLTPQRLAFLGSGLVGSLAILTIDFAVVLLLAGCSWKFFESPILALKHRFEDQRSPEISRGQAENSAGSCT